MAFHENKNNIRDINKRLRVFCEENSIFDYKISNIPLGGGIKDSIGPWPEYIIHGVKCPRSENGLCSPCGYSCDGYSQEQIKDQGINVKEYMYNQSIKIIKNFKNMVIDKQYYSILGAKKIFFAYTTLGSFFSDNDMSFKDKLSILKQLQEIAKKESIEIYFVTEAHAMDVINYEKNGKLSILNDLLISLNSVVILGFESVDDFIRNQIYYKDLSIQEFEKAINILKNRNITPAAFIYIGGNTLLQKEVVDNFSTSLKYLYGLSVIPVLMIENLKKGTLDELLFKFGNKILVEPRTIENILKILKENQISLTPFPWLIADPVGGPPVPLIHPFNSNMRCSCNECSFSILIALRYLRKTYDWKGYEIILSPEVRECTCNDKYKNHLELEANERLGIEDRLERNIQIAHLNMNRYFEYLINLKNKKE